MSDRIEPQLGPVQDLLRKYTGKTCFFEHEGGNNGDELIRMGSQFAIARAGLNLTDNLDKADLIIVRGGGGMNDFLPGTLDRLSGLLNEYHLPIIVLPQSYKFAHTDFPALFKGRGDAPVFLYARERTSLEALCSMQFHPSVRVGIDHDMAMVLEGGDFVRALGERARRRHILIVERKDVEAECPIDRKPFPFPALRDAIPISTRIKIKRGIRWALSGRNAKSAFADRLKGIALEQYPQYADDPTIAMDISDKGTASFEYFCSLIADSSIVITNRLHVGILGALLGKPTYLREGSYHKIRGIHEYSLSRMSHVRIVE